MDEDFPVFIPISDYPQGTLSKLRHADNRIAEVEEKVRNWRRVCFTNFRAPKVVQHGIDAREFTYCLEVAVTSGKESIVRKLGTVS